MVVQDLLNQKVNNQIRKLRPKDGINLDFLCRQYLKILRIKYHSQQ